MNKKDNTDEYSCFVNRELSWLQFNERVLEEAESENTPLLERLNFISIFQSNLDEFFMVRVGALHDAMLVSAKSKDNKTGMTPKQQIKAILERVEKLLVRRDDAYASIMKKIEEYGVRVPKFSELSEKELDYVRSCFRTDIKPLLFPTIFGKKQPFPFLKNKEVYGFAVLETKSGKRKVAFVPSLSLMFPRTIEIPDLSGSGSVSVIPVDDVILHFFGEIFPGYKVVEKTQIRIIRNADIDESRVYDEDLDYRDHMSEVVKMRKKLCPVRLDISRPISEGALSELCGLLRLERSCVFLSGMPLTTDHISAVKQKLSDRPELCYKKRTPQRSPEIADTPIIPQIIKKDILLHYPYENISMFLRMLSEAAKDKNVISIQMTLYRLAKHSKVVEALVEAAENGKEVNVLVELKARFDEENNINWSKRLEEAGCHVIYGVDELKVHSKICLITRKNGSSKKIQYITQIGTGNYNESTSRLYTDLSLFTADQALGEETAEVFRRLMMGETVSQTNLLMVAPNCLLDKVLEKIDREIEKAKAGKPAYVGAKLNSLTDKKIMEKLIEASCAGVKIEMVIRGICCLKPGIEGKTENISIISIVGRLLEHSRIYIFGAESDCEVYIASADFMTRNTVRRVEVAAPVLDERLKNRVLDIFNVFKKDNTAARVMLPDGSYVRKTPDGSEPFNAQEYLYDEAYSAAKEN
ncbi:MAG: polyphosphate kinase 1 [Oscillospiraceae bacterium]